MKVQSIPLSKIDQNENSRVVYKKGDVIELMESMKKRGILQPIGVRPAPGGRFEAVYGNRRILAATKLDWKDIPAVILDEIADDTERDLTNLSENIKRQNTSVSEEGRIYCALIDRGLTVPEIAARLDVSPQRIQTGVDVFRHVPDDLKRDIVFTPQGRKKAAGKISATAAHAIMSVRKAEGLNRKQVRTLMNYAKETDATTQHISQLGPMIADGATISQAIKLVKEMERVTLFFFMETRRIEKLEKKYGCPINELLMKQLERNTELKVQRTVTHGKAHFRRDMRSAQSAKKIG